MVHIVGQIPFTLSFKIAQPNKNVLCIVYLRYYSKDNEINLSASIRISKKNWIKQKEQDHSASNQMNNILWNFRVVVEQRAIVPGAMITKDYLEDGSGSSNSLKSYETFI